MVGDHHVDVRPAGRVHGIVAVGAAIHGDDQTQARIGLDDLFDLVGLQTVSFLQAVRYIIGDHGAGLFEKLVQQNGRCDAVHVVVAENQDLLPVPDGFCDALRGGAHVGQGERIAQPTQGGRQKVLDFLGAAQVSVRQHLGGHRMAAQGIIYVPDLFRVRPEYVQFFIHTP